MDTNLNPSPDSTSVNPAQKKDLNSKKSPFGVFRTLFESGSANDFEAMADTIDAN